MKQDKRSSSLSDVGEPAGAGFDRWGTKYGPPLRVPPTELTGQRNEDKPCLTPIDCVMAKRCAGHCGCR
jgi:hypothetical protein